MGRIFQKLETLYVGRYGRDQTLRLQLGFFSSHLDIKNMRKITVFEPDSQLIESFQKLLHTFDCFMKTKTRHTSHIVEMEIELSGGNLYIAKQMRRGINSFCRPRQKALDASIAYRQTKGIGGNIRQVVSFIDYKILIGRQNATMRGGISQQESMVDHNQISFLCPSFGIKVETAVEIGTTIAQTII
ncbi:MAG: hypothetical protein BWY75_03371 [bacterium ADurb.Bin425]|nr:MAG: hypothetical protein BWY75_03371 [bacterium ADurb.Bin425]